MFYRYGGSFFGTMCETNDWVRMYQSPKLECIVNQSIWMEGESKLRRCDPAGLHQLRAQRHRRVRQHRRLLQPRLLGQQLPGHRLPAQMRGAGGRIEVGLPHLRGLGGADGAGRHLHRGQDRGRLDQTGLRGLRHAEGDVVRGLQEEGLLHRPVPDDYKPTPALRWFYEDRPCDTPDHNPYKNDPDPERRKGLGTFSGKIEFVSESLKQFTPDDEERAPMPRYQDSWEGHSVPARSSSRSRSSRRIPAMRITRTTTSTARGCGRYRSIA